MVLPGTEIGDVRDEFRIGHVEIEESSVHLKRWELGEHQIS